MSVNGDLRREERLKARGYARLTARITGNAHDALALLAAHYRLDQRQVLEGLLLAAGAVLCRSEDHQTLAVMRDHRMSRPEAELFRNMLAAALTPQPELETAHG